MRRLFIVCRDCLNEPNIAFEHCGIAVAQWTANGWNPHGVGIKFYDFFVTHMHSAPQPEKLQFVMIDEDSMEPQARSKAKAVAAEA